MEAEGLQPGAEGQGAGEQSVERDALAGHPLTKTGATSSTTHGNVVDMGSTDDAPAPRHRPPHPR
jgi:hypothetical protein